jgi:hypothetical protein
MKPRIYKSGLCWIGELDGFRYSFLLHSSAIESALQRFANDKPLAWWLAERLEPIGV